MDQTLRTLERDALVDEIAAEQLLARQLRAGEAAQVVRGFVELLTPEGSLWVAGCTYAFFCFHYADTRASTALLQYFVEGGLAWGAAYRAADDPRVHAAIVRACRARAKKEWDPIRAIGVLGPRYRVRLALGLERMPPGTTEEEVRLRENPADPFAVEYFYRDGRIRPRRRPKDPPTAMGWEPLLDRLWAESLGVYRPRRGQRLSLTQQRPCMLNQPGTSLLVPVPLATNEANPESTMLHGLQPTTPHEPHEPPPDLRFAIL